MPISGAPSATARRTSASSCASTSTSMPSRSASAITAARLLVVEHREHRQHRVGAVQPRLGDLARIDDEILGEDRPVKDRAAPRARSSSEPPK